jgi:hypothetical protein
LWHARQAVRPAWLAGSFGAPPEAVVVAAAVVVVAGFVVVTAAVVVAGFVVVAAAVVVAGLLVVVDELPPHAASKVSATMMATAIAQGSSLFDRISLSPFIPYYHGSPGVFQPYRQEGSSSSFPPVIVHYSHPQGNGQA